MFPSCGPNPLSYTVTQGDGATLTWKPIPRPSAWMYLIDVVLVPTLREPWEQSRHLPSESCTPGQLVSCVSLVALKTCTVERSARLTLCTGSLLCCELSGWLVLNVGFGGNYSARNRSFFCRERGRDNSTLLRTETKQASFSNPKTPKVEPKTH